MSTENTSENSTYGNDMNLVEKWIRKDLTRWKAGILAGCIAGLVAVLVGGLFSLAGGREFFYPLKFLATPFVGAAATYFTMDLGTLVIGLIFIEVLSAFLGFIFGHFVFTNHLPSLLAMGAAWGAFSWVFLWNLFFNSFKPMLWAHIPSGIGFAICMLYGLSFATVGTLDKFLRK